MSPMVQSPPAARVALLLALPALGGVWAQGSPPVQITNVGYETTTDVEVDAGRVAFLVHEASESADLNGDGDAEDLVPHVYDHVGGGVANLGLAASFELHLDGGRVAFKVEEYAQGLADRNGDGDPWDQVVHVHDPLTGVTTNLGLASDPAPMVLGEGVVAFLVNEDSQGMTDLNGDGDAEDSVVHVHYPGTGLTVNTGLASYALEERWLGEGVLAIGVDEYAQGQTDLNGDGDTLDDVWHTFRLAGKSVQNHGLTAVTVEPVHGHLAVPVREAGQGQTDLNGDGDANDRVLHLVRLSNGSATNFGLATIGLAPAGRHLAALVYEVDQGGADLNSDGDGGDRVVHLVDVASYTSFNLGLASSGLIVDGARVVVQVSESAQGGADLNGDGDAGDDVYYTVEPVQLGVTNLGLAAGGAELRGHRLVLAVSEAAQGDTDLNGDGDKSDWVLYHRDLVAKTTVPYGLAVNLPEEGADALFSVSEFSQKADLDGDGDMSDPVVFAQEFGAGAPVNLGIPGTPVAFDEGLAAFSVFEGWVAGGTDLNGDGDVADSVLHVAEPTYGFGLEADADVLSLGPGGVQALTLDAGTAQGGELYLLVGSFAGTSPGIPIGGGAVLPLAFDPYLDFSLQNPNTPPLSNSLGTLDPWGEGAAAFAVPAGLDPAFAGAAVHHAYAALDPLSPGEIFVSNPVAVQIVL